MASYLPTSYLPASLQKRLLRSALSSLGLFDPASLEDLDNLDLSFGRKSTLSLRGVGLDVHRLRTILALPDELHIQSANVNALTLVLPADIHRTGIQVSITGVRCHGVLDAGSDSASELSAELAAKSEILNKDKELLSKLPSVVDLADSFVEGQSARERRRLVRSVLKGFTDESGSSSSDDEGSRDSDQEDERKRPPTPPRGKPAESIPTTTPQDTKDGGKESDKDSDSSSEDEIGMGTPLALPAFLASFLKGVGDRVQISISDVRLTLQVEPAPPKSPDELPQNPVYVELEVEDLEVEGVTAMSAIAIPEFKVSESGGEGQNKREGKRRIAMNRLKAYLVADESLFESPLAQPATTTASTPGGPGTDGADDMEKSASTIRSATKGAASESPPAASDRMQESVETVRYAEPQKAVSVYSQQMEDSMSGEESIYHEYSDDHTSDYDMPSGSDRSGITQVYEECSAPPSEYDVESLEEFHDDLEERQQRSDPLTESQMFADYEDEDEEEGMYSTYSSDGGGDEDDALANSVLLPLPTPAMDFLAPPHSQSESSFSLASTSPPAARSVSPTSIPLPLSTSPSIIASPPSPSIIPLPPSLSTSILSHSSSSSDDEMTEAERRELSRSMLFSREEAGSLYHSAMSGASGSSTILRHSTSGRGEDEAIPEDELEERLSRLIQGSHIDLAASASSLGREPPAREVRREKRLRKSILEVERVEVFVPAISESVPVALPPPPAPKSPKQESVEQSMYHGHVPGAFSMYASSPPRPSSSSAAAPKSPKSPKQTEPPPPQPPQLKSPSQPPQRTPSDLLPDRDIEVLVGRVSFKSDLGTGKLLLNIIETLAGAQFPESAGDVEDLAKAVESGAKEGGLEVSIKEIECVLVDQLQSTVADSTSPSTSDKGEDDSDPDANKEEEILLRASIQDTTILNTKLDSPVTSQITKILLGKLTLKDSRSDDIIHFIPVSGRQAKRRQALNEDVAVTVAKVGERMKVNLETLCCVVTLRLDRVEELLAQVGGIGSVVGLASSVSTTRPGGWQREREREQQGGKGVRWEDQASGSAAPVDESTTENPLKVDAVIGGMKLALISKDSEAQVNLHTSAVKLKKRPEGITLVIDKIQAFGPEAELLATNATIDHTRIEFQERPSEDEDLPRLLRLLTPSKDRFGEEDDILIDTLLRQRKQGAIVRVVAQKVNASLAGTEDLENLKKVGDDILRIVAVTNFVAQDERPGILSFILAKEFVADLDLGEKIGVLDVNAKDVELAHVSAPMLLCSSVRTIDVKRNRDEDLVGEGMERELMPASERERPVLMVRLVGDEPEPVVKVKCWNLRLEYRVETVMEVTDTKPGATTEEMAANMIESVAELGGGSGKGKGKEKAVDDDDEKSPATTNDGPGASTLTTADLSSSSSSQKSLALNIALRDTVLALNPLSLKSRALIVLTEANVLVDLPSTSSPLKTEVLLGKANLFLVDDMGTLVKPGALAAGMPGRRKRRSALPEGLSRFADMGYVNMAEISKARVLLSLLENPVAEKVVDPESGEEREEVEVKKTAEVYLSTKLLFLETCADSTQTMIELLNGLKPPQLEEEQIKYCTEVVDIDVFQSIIEDGLKPDFLKGGREAVIAAGLAEALADVNNSNSLPFDASTTDMVDDDVPNNLGFVEDFYGAGSSKRQRGDGRGREEVMMPEDLLEEELTVIARPPKTLRYNEKGMLSSFTEQIHVLDDAPLVIKEDHFGGGGAASSSSSSKPAVTPASASTRTSAQKKPVEKYPGMQHFYKWDSDRQRKVPLAPEDRFSPLIVHVEDVNVVWNLHDGYDWQHTRDTITKTVRGLEKKASDRQRSSRASGEDEYEFEEEPIGDFLFNSIYIGIPANKDPRQLAEQINHTFDDALSETGSYVSSGTETRLSSLDYHPSSHHHRHAHAPSTSSLHHRRAQPPAHSLDKKLRLHRSRTHKVQIELKGVYADFILFPPQSHETQCMLDLRVRDFHVVDNVPTSTWRMFVTYMKDAGEREVGSSMAHLEVLNVRPVLELAATELVIKVTLLPLRLHVDQDTLDFITRFFEFKDTSSPASSTPQDNPHDPQPFLQRVEVNSVRVRLDYKPKKVDYAGLRSGHTTEFMNFFILEEADMIMRHVILHGVAGMQALNKELNGTWMPDIKKTQLGPVLAGVAPVRSLVNLGTGVKNLVAVPVREYKKDGRVIRSLQHGASQFVKHTTEELVRLGAKVAVGTQTLLEGAEGILSPESANTLRDDHMLHLHDSDSEDDVPGGGFDGLGTSPSTSDPTTTTKQLISPYASQPPTLRAGMSSAYASLNRNLTAARHALAAIPQEAREKGSVVGAAEAVVRNAPRVVIRPLVGVSEAVGKVALGAGNSLDWEGRRRGRREDKWKKY